MTQPMILWRTPVRTLRFALLVTAGALALTSCGGDDTVPVTGTAGSTDLAPPSAAADESAVPGAATLSRTPAP